MTCSNNTNCIDEFGCPSNVCPDFTIKRHDTKPAFEIIVKDCNNPIDLTSAVVEVSMWAKGKLKKAVAEADDYFALADNVGFQQSMVGDIILMETIRSPEQMLVTGFDETNKLIQVQRGYNGTTVRAYKKGASLRIFRFMNSVGETQMTLRDVLQIDGTTDSDVLVESKLIYEWQPTDTCLPGCYYMEFKLLMMEEEESMAVTPPLSLTSSIIPSFISYSPDQMGCQIGDGVQWVRRFPVDNDGFLVKIVDSPTSEILV